ncbi:amidase [Sphingobium sp. AS12]|uniref:amidase n=1 Tax=Sphingobium sp. AS12 TaxID=2849495 RepID=UPI001C312C75|nr:amidase [Sphingobium sp. AS12]MBV2149807.1 amidase [Sphingobium sp. AS12]
MTSGYLVRFPTRGESPRLAVKDSIDLAGQRTGMGSPAFAQTQPAQRNAEVVDKLLAARFEIAGKTRLHGLALGATGINAWSGTPINPSFPELVPGGSSSGSAAVIAAGEAELAIGTDTGGSVRVPAACCGVFGLKTTAGLISRAGVHPAASSLDVVGLFARDPAVIARALHAVTVDAPLSDRPIRRLGRIQIAADLDVDAAVTVACVHANLTVDPVVWPGMKAAFKAGLALINAESWDAYGELVEAGLLPADVSERLRAGSRVTDAQRLEAEAVRRRARLEVDALLAQVDALLLPTLAIFPPSLAEGGADPSGIALTALVRPFNLTGHPALSVPIARTKRGPIAMQIVGRLGSDLALCDFAKNMFPANHNQGGAA